MVLALFLSQFRQMHPMLRLLLCGAIVGAPCLLILMQPDLGECIIWGPVLLALLFVGGIPLRYLICIVLIARRVYSGRLHLGLKPYQQERITAFINPDIDRQGSAWAINQSLIAIGSGGWAGKGFKAPNTQIELGFLPATAVHNDYIFSAIGEQWGFVGGIILARRVRACFLLTCLFVAFIAGDQFGPASGHRNHGADFHAHFSEHRDDDLDAADHRCAVAADQLQRLVCAHDHVRSRHREQRLGPSQSPGSLIAGDPSGRLVRQTAAFDILPVPDDHFDQYPARYRGDRCRSHDVGHPDAASEERRSRRGFRRRRDGEYFRRANHHRLTTATTWLASIFFVIVLLLSVLYAHQERLNSAVRRELMKTSAAQKAAQPLPVKAAAKGAAADAKAHLDPVVKGTIAPIGSASGPTAADAAVGVVPTSALVAPSPAASPAATP